jgi:hypothetical protein
VVVGCCGRRLKSRASKKISMENEKKEKEKNETKRGTIK